MTAHIHSLATAVPENKVNQEEVLGALGLVHDLSTHETDRLKKVFLNTGIDSRYLAAPLEWFQSPQGWQQRNQLYCKESLSLLKKVATDALDQAGWKPEEVDHIVTVSTTGIATPSLEARLMEELPFGIDTLRTPIFGLGCAGGVSGLNRAADFSAAHPGQKILLLVVELCSLSFQADKLKKKHLISAALFSDGAAAVTLSTEPGHLVVKANKERKWPDSLGIMGWDVTEQGLSVVFDRSIPDLVRDQLGQLIHDFASENQLDPRDLKKHICHPGGAKVLDAIEQVLELPGGSLLESRHTLKNYGNMSAPTVLFALKKAWPYFNKGDQAMLAALGPGFTGALSLVEATHA